MQRTITTQKLFRFQCDILVAKNTRRFMKGVSIMIDKNKLNELLIEAKTNLVEQARLVGKTAELMDHLIETIQNEELNRDEMLALVSANLHYYHDLERFMDEATSDEEKTLYKILDLIRDQNKD